MLKKLPKKYLVIIIFISILFLGFIARLHHLNISNLWYDEAFSGMLVKEDFSNLINIIIQDKVHPPLYYILLKVWVELFGNTILSIKAFSIIFGLILIATAFVLIKKLHSTKAALISAFVFSLSPFFILYSLEARSYIMLGFLCVIAIFLYLKLQTSSIKTLKDLITSKYFKYLGAIFILMLLTHYLAIALIVSILVMLSIKIAPKLFKPATLISGILLLIVLLNGFLNNGNFRIISKEGTHTSWLSDAKPISTFEMLYSFLFGNQSQSLGDQPAFKLNFVENNSVILIIFAVIIIFAILQFLKTKDLILKSINLLFIFTLNLVAVTSIAGINIFLPRYLMFLGILFIIWLSIGLSKLKLKFIFLSLVIYTLLLTQINWKDYSKSFNFKELESVILNQRILVNSPFDYLVLKYYFGSNPNLYLFDPNKSMINNPWAFYTRKQILIEKEVSDYII